MQLAHNSILFCLVGPAGSGKTPLAKRLISSPNSNLFKIVSVTSRAPRPAEIPDVNYKFVSRAQFEESIAKGDFFEWEEIHGNLYGQLNSSIEAALKSNLDTIFDIDIRGAHSLHAKFPRETVIIFLLPPGKQALKDRILARAPISPAELSERMQTAERELQAFYDAYKAEELIDYALVNSDFEVTLSTLAKIIETERCRLSRIKSEVLKSLVE